MYKTEWLTRCHKPVTVTLEMSGQGTVVLLPGTRAISTGNAYVLPDGSLSGSYVEADADALIRDGVVAVEHIRLTGARGKASEGWTVRGTLQCDCGPFP